MEEIFIEFKTKIPQQVELAEAWIDDVTEEMLYGGGKGGGKSFGGVSLIFGDALTYPETQYFIARKELNDLRKFTVPTIHEVFQKWKLPIDKYAKFNGQDNFYTLYNGSKVFLIQCKEEPSDPMFERFGSIQVTRGMIEEGGEVPQKAKENLRLTIGRWKNKEYGLKPKLLITANPKKGWMKQEFVDPFYAGTLPNNKKFIKALARDNSYLTDEYVASLHAIKDKVTNERLAQGIWDYDEDNNSLVTFDNLTDAFSNTIVKDGNKYLVVDVARLGKDTTVFTIWDGLELVEVHQFQRQDTAVTAQKIKDYAASNGIPYSNIIIDEDGIGGGVVDNLFGVKGFTANSTPLQTVTEIRSRENKINSSYTPRTSFFNLKAQCGWKLSELINEHKIAVKVPEYRDKIIEELTALLKQKNVDSDGKKQLRPKSEVKEELRRSPDVGDCMIMRAWFELSKAEASEDPRRVKAVEEQKVSFMRNARHQRSNK